MTKPRGTQSQLQPLKIAPLFYCTAVIRWNVFDTVRRAV